jgi:hypothetical protein
MWRSVGRASDLGKGREGGRRKEQNGWREDLTGEREEEKDGALCVQR